jgi:hypothetical protein
MNIMEIKKGYNYIENFGAFQVITEFSDHGFQKSIKELVNILMGNNNLYFKGLKNVDIKELKKIISSLIMKNANVNINLEIKDANILKLKNSMNINYIVYLDTKFKYSEEFFEYYNNKNSKFIIKENFINQLLKTYLIQKQKIFILLDSIDKDSLIQCKNNEYNFLYDMSILKDLMEVRKDGTNC